MDRGPEASRSGKQREHPIGTRKVKHFSRQKKVKQLDRNRARAATREPEENIRQTFPQDQAVAAVKDEPQIGTQVDTEEGLSPFSSLLRHFLRRDHAEIARVARELEVSENTVYRWMNGHSEPREIYLKKLPDVLSNHRSELIYAINQTFGRAFDLPAANLPEIHKNIYRQVLDFLTTTADDDTRFWQVSQALFDFALQQLDSTHQGLAVTYSSLMPAHKDGIHSLRESAMRGNHPWPLNLESKAYLGSTTLVGSAAQLQRLQIWNSVDPGERLLVAIDEFERSACAYPVMRAGRIAGVLSVSSTQANFFTNPAASQAVIEYAQLMSLALREQDFQPISLLSLRPMPDLQWQRAELARSYVNRIITYAYKYNVPRQEAERCVQSEMELEFEELGRQPHQQNTDQQLFQKLS